jgi:hypothetical protein
MPPHPQQPDGFELSHKVPPVYFVIDAPHEVYMLKMPDRVGHPADALQTPFSHLPAVHLIFGIHHQQRLNYSKIK